MSTSPKNDNLLRSIFEVLISHGLEGFNPVFQTLLNEAMKAERSEFLNAAPYERNASRKGYANGYKGKTLCTRIGEMRVRIPQVRGLSFYPQSLDKGCRSEVALVSGHLKTRH
jgi:transposase-like protein